ncbi:MAG: Beta helix protein, partial [Bacteroidetes bacterium]|nr:Beta helix protein [Bacteroidota bacterium]
MKAVAAEDRQNSQLFFLKEATMKRLATLVSFLLVLVTVASGQPMSGNYTVGGISPNFLTLQDAASAIKSRGVSGPVFINVRPGTYTRNGGTSTVFRLDSIIAGVSPTNRITFQPDAAAGGNVDNVILQADFNSSSNPRVVAFVRTDYTTIRNLTFKDADSMDTPVFTFLDASFDQWNLSIEGLEVDGCKFIGTPYFTGSFGTDLGIFSSTNLASASFTHNRFYGIFRAITNRGGLSSRAGTFVVEDNEFYEGTGDAFTFAIQLNPIQASVRRNIIDLAGGGGIKFGIEVVHSTSAVIERNFINNRESGGGNFTGILVASPSGFVTDSILIANNVVITIPTLSRATCMKVETPNTKVLYNTLIHGGGPDFDNIALFSIGANCTVLNNIILANFAYMAFDQGIAGQAQNLVSDYNIIFHSNPFSFGGLVRRNGTVFTSLAGYQAATGLDSHSVSKSISFSDQFHLDTCQAQDPDLNGIPVPGITEDYDGAPRDSVKPFRGADESVRIPFDMFADGFRAGLSGTPFSVAAGDFFDNDNDDDIAVPDYTNRRIQLFRNLRPSRSFVQSGILSTSVQPGVIKLFDFDDDGHLDLIVGGDEAAVDVFWGNAAGGFGSRVTVGTFGRVRSIEPEPFVAQSPFKTIWITEDNGFLPSTGFLGYLFNLGGRQLCHDVKYRQGPPPSFFYIPDTIPTVMTDLVVGNIDTTNDYEVIALGVSPLPSRFVVFHELVALLLVGFPCNDAGYDGVYAQHQFGT